MEEYAGHEVDLYLWQHVEDEAESKIGSGGIEQLKPVHPAKKRRKRRAYAGGSKDKMRNEEAVRILQTPFIISLFAGLDSDDENESESEGEEVEDGAKLEDALHQIQVDLYPLNEYISSKNYWEGLVENRLTISEQKLVPSWENSQKESAVGLGQSLRESMDNKGFFASQAWEPLLDLHLEKLIQCIAQIKEKGYPAVFVFMFDEFWMLWLELWPIMNSLLGDDHCLLEPSFFIYALEKPSKEKLLAVQPDNKFTYLGGNFGLPHRDHTFSESNFEDGSPAMVSIWLPLTNATLDNGCMYVVPKVFDPFFSKPEHFAHMRSATRKDDALTTDDEYEVGLTKVRFDMSAARALPASAGSILGWHGNLIHWGSRCNFEADIARISATCTFRRNDAPPTGLQGAIGAITYQQATGLSIRQRLQLVAKSLITYKWWYGLPDSAVPPEFYS